jgi:hypothetical protein
MGHYIVVLGLLPDMDIYILKFGMVWYGMVWYGMVWYGMVWYVRCNHCFTVYFIYRSGKFYIK